MYTRVINGAMLVDGIKKKLRTCPPETLLGYIDIDFVSSTSLTILSRDRGDDQFSPDVQVPLTAT